jgi:hypothetical protein
MKARWIRVVVASGGVFALASLARADAPPDQYGLFNSTYQAIQDVQTGLLWQRYPVTVSYTTALSFNDAATYCATLSLDGNATGWRVPSYKELLTLVDEAPHVEYENGGLTTKWIDGNAFPGTAVDEPYWTSSLYPLQSGYAYVVDFSTGIPVQAATGKQNYVRCVH